MSQEPETGTAAAPSGGEGHRTSPLGMAVSAVDMMRQMVLPIVAVVIGTQNFGMTVGVTAAIAATVLVVAVGSTWLRWSRLKYFIRETDIRVESGIVSLAKRSVPYERIQDVSLEQKLIPRLFGLVEVRFETGAGGKDELHLAYVSESEGARLRELVRRRQEEDEAAAGGEGEVAEETRGQIEEGELLFAMGPKRIFTFGLFEFSLVVFAVLAGLAQQLEFFVDFDIWDLDLWRDIAGQGSDRISSLGRMGQVLGAVAGLISLVFVGFATGLARTAAREWDFRLTRTAKGFRRRRGLFTRTDVLMPAHRVQAASLGTGVIRRFFGWHSLKFVSLAQDSGAANHVVAPFARRAEIDPIAAEAGIDLSMDGLPWLQPSSSYWLDRTLVVSSFAAIVAGGWWIFDRALVGAAIFLGVTAIAAIANGLASLRYRHVMDEGQLLIRTGFLSPNYIVAPQVRLQSVEIAQGPLARLRGYCEVHFGLPGGRMHIHGVPVGEARMLRDSILQWIARTDYSRLDDQKIRPLSNLLTTT